MKLAFIVLILCVNKISLQTIAKYDISIDEFRQLNDEYTGNNYRVISIIGYELNNNETYSAIWSFNHNNISTVVDVGLDGDALQLAFFNTKDNYIITFVTSYAIDNRQYYAYIAEAITVNFNDYDSQVYYDMSFYQFFEKINYHTSMNYRLRFINSYVVDGFEQYVAIFDNRTVANWTYGIRLTASEYQTQYDSLISQGYKLLSISGYNYTEDGSTVMRDAYAAVWVIEGIYFCLLNIFSIIFYYNQYKRFFNSR